MGKKRHRQQNDHADSKLNGVGVIVNEHKVIESEEPQALPPSFTTSESVAPTPPSDTHKKKRRKKKKHHNVNSNEDSNNSSSKNNDDNNHGAQSTVKVKEHHHKHHHKEHHDKGKFKREEKAAALRPQREKLPITIEKASIMEAVKVHNSLIIVGETGSGKTTQIPQFLYEAGYAKKGMIAITQPRRVAATSIARRVSEEMAAKLGGLVGYSVRFDDTTSQDTKIKYMTDGMMLRELLSDKLLSKYSVILLDEAHERTLRTDILFGMVKSIQKVRPDLKVLVMSATLDAERFSKYFNNAPVLNIPGRTFPVRIFNAAEKQEDYVDAAVVSTFQIHVDEPPGDILVFLTGQEEIEAVEKLLLEHAHELPPEAMTMFVCPLFASMPAAAQQKVFQPAPPNHRKIILATNVAETSLTISGIRYVIDTGMAKVRAFNSKLGLESLAAIPISKASARQRTGRAGREAPGCCYRLYTSEGFDSLDENTEPEILRCNLANVLLTLKASGVDDIINFEFIDRPPRDAIIRALEHLYALKALGNDGSLTEEGKKMAQFPIDPSLAKVLLYSKTLKCTAEVISIISLLSVENVFFSPHDKREQAAEAKKKFVNYDGDHITLLNVMRGYEAVNGDVEWCNQNFINHRAMRNAVDIRKQLASFCEGMDISPTVSVGNEVEPILQSFVMQRDMMLPNLVPDAGQVNTTTNDDDKHAEVHNASSEHGHGKMKAKDPYAYRHYNPLNPTCNKILAKRWEEHSRELHYRRLKQARPSIDTSPPKVYPHLEMRLKRMQVEEERLLDIERKNHILLDRIMFQMVNPSVASHQKFRKREKDNLDFIMGASYQRRKREMDRIQKDNLVILQRIENKEPNYNRLEWLADRKKNLYYLCNIAQYPTHYLELLEEEFAETMSQQKPKSRASRPVTHGKPGSRFQNRPPSRGASAAKAPLSEESEHPFGDLEAEATGSKASVEAGSKSKTPGTKKKVVTVVGTEKPGTRAKTEHEKSIRATEKMTPNKPAMKSTEKAKGHECVKEQKSESTSEVTAQSTSTILPPVDVGKPVAYTSSRPSSAVQASNEVPVAEAESQQEDAVEKVASVRASKVSLPNVTNDVNEDKSRPTSAKSKQKSKSNVLLNENEVQNAAEETQAPVDGERKLSAKSRSKMSLQGDADAEATKQTSQRNSTKSRSKIQLNEEEPAKEAEATEAPVDDAPRMSTKSKASLKEMEALKETEVAPSSQRNSTKSRSKAQLNEEQAPVEAEATPEAPV
ncbi:putative ATP-dependent RNA helicase dhr2, partial [Chytridiales sp. JEL 0842]